MHYPAELSEPGPSGHSVDPHADVLLDLDSHLDEQRSEGSTDTYRSDQELDDMKDNSIHLPSDDFNQFRSLNPDNPFRASARKTLRNRKSVKRPDLDSNASAEDIALKAIISSHTHEAGDAIGLMQKCDAIKDLPTSMNRKKSIR